MYLEEDSKFTFLSFEQTRVREARHLIGLHSAFVKKSENWGE